MIIFILSILGFVGVLLLTKLGRTFINKSVKFIAISLWEWGQIAFFCIFVAYFIAGLIGLKP